MKKRMQAIALMMALILLLGSMSGCKRAEEEEMHTLGPSQSEQTPSEDQKDPEPISPTPLSVTDLTQEISYTEEWIEKELDEAFIAAQMDFSAEIFRRAAKEIRCKNTLISPLSISMALAMTANGASGKTAEQMLDVLGGHSIEDLNAYLANWRVALQSDEEATLQMGNSIWIRELQGFDAKDQFLQDNAKYYNSQVFKAPFNSFGIEQMNLWVKQKTNGMIPKMIEQLNSDTMMVLMNAIGFDAQWSDPYTDYSIRDEDFTTIDGKKQTVKMMHSTEYTYLEGEGAIGFLRPYQGGRYAFGALLPEGDFEKYVETLSGDTLLKILENKQRTQVRASLPQFKNQYRLTLNDLLSEMGMSAAFDGGFEKMSNTDLFISEVLHEAVIEVHKDGTRAAAATAVMMDKATAPMAEPKVVTLDRPFIYFIIDTQTNLPIFIGTVTSI